ncbi:MULTISPECIES: hypothetical protein [unclassified Microcoleus]
MPAKQEFCQENPPAYKVLSACAILEQKGVIEPDLIGVPETEYSQRK